MRFPAFYRACLLLLAAALCFLAVPGQTATRYVTSIAFDMTFEAGTPYAAQFGNLEELPYEDQLSVMKYVASRTARIVEKESKASQVSLQFGPGAGGSNPAHVTGVLTLVGTDQQVSNGMDILGYLLQTGFQLGQRRDATGDYLAGEVVQLSGKSFTKAEAVDQFWTRLGQVAPRLQTGYTPYKDAGRPALRMIDLDQIWTGADLTDLDSAVELIAAEQGLSLGVRHTYVQVLFSTNDYTVAPNGEQYLERLAVNGRSGLTDRLQNKYNAQVEGWIETALEKVE